MGSRKERRGQKTLTLKEWQRREKKRQEVKEWATELGILFGGCALCYGIMWAICAVAFVM